MLLTKKTDLKSLKYGGDRLGGGSSNQPYIQTDINTGQLSVSNSKGIGLLQPIDTAITGVANTINRIGGVIGNVDDGFIRGGAIGAAQASTTDLLRIGKFFTDAPKGPLFLARQVGLQLSNPRLEVKKGTRGILSSITNLDLQGAAASLTGGTFQPTRIYNLGINTLAQVPVNAFGIHFNRHGLLPFQDDDSKYLKIAQLNNEGKDSPNNRLVGLKNQLKLGDQKLNNPPSLLRKIANLPFKIIGSVLKGQPLDIFKGEDTLDYYIGGPKSVYGIGTTTIKRYDYTENKTRINDALSQSNDKARLAKIDWNLALGGNYPISGRDNASPSKIAKSLDNKTEIFNPNVENQNVVQELNTISPAAKDYNKLKKAIDSVRDNSPKTIAGSTVPNAYFKNQTFGPYKNKEFNSQPNIGLDRTPSTPFRYYGKAKSSDDGSQLTYDNSNMFARKDADILTVVFRVIDPFSPIPALNSSTEKSRRHAFSAYMKGYKDGFNATWNETNYVGRAESFYVYNKFKRTVSFNLQIPCFNRKELFEKHRNLGQLAATTAGTYSNGFLGGTLVQINLGNYLVGEYGILNNLDFSIPDESSWDTTPEGRLAMLVEASFNFTIVHKELPQYEVDGGFFKYLPNQTTGFLPSVSNVSSFVYNNYEKVERGDTELTSVPDSVIQVPPNDISFVRRAEIVSTVGGLSKPPEKLPQIDLRTGKVTPSPLANFIDTPINNNTNQNGSLA